MIVEPLARIATSLVEKRFTLEFPEKKESLPDSYRGNFRLDMKTCVSCSACERICPNKTIYMVDVETDRGTKKMPEIHIDRCLFCGLCEEVCPTDCLVLTKEYDFEAYDRREFVKRPEELE